MTEHDPEDERWLRDSDWVRTSPFLMPCELPIELAHAHAPAPGKRYRGHRVGYYFETLVEAMLRATPGNQMLACGQQVIEDGRTLGELDFVFRDSDGQVHHWEVAAKFYLHCADRQVRGSHFIGPNAGDTFERKRSKIIEQQLPLSRSTYPDVTRQTAFVKGMIFYHPQQDPPAQQPEGLHPDHLRGTWLRHSELSLLDRGDGAGAFRVMRKPWWFAPEILPDGHPSLLASVEFEKHLREHFLEKNHPLLLAAMEEHAGGWREIDRIFVVSDQWPG